MPAARIPIPMAGPENRLPITGSFPSVAAIIGCTCWPKIGANSKPQMP